MTTDTEQVEPLSAQEEAEAELEASLKKLNKRTITIRRRIEIDAGHRVTEHKSKCKNLHGHRYRIEAMVTAEELISEGSERGMIMDFGFLKEDMKAVIDKRCDHTMMLWIDDPLFNMLFNNEALMNNTRKVVEDNGSISLDSKFGRFYILDCVPTAENLAKHWGDRLDEKIQERTDGRVRLSMLVVWETPNCSALYAPSDPDRVKWLVNYRMAVAQTEDESEDDVGKAT